MAALAGERDGVLAGLVDSDTFFERAARGERDTQPAVAADRGQGAATMPRDPRPHAPRADDDAPSAPRRLATPRRHTRLVAVAATAGAFAVVGLLVATMSDGQRAPARQTAVEPPAEPSAPIRSPVDVLGPRPGHVDVDNGRIAGIAIDAGSGVRRIELVVNGRRADADTAVCRPECPPAARFTLDVPPHGRTELRSLAVVAHDAAGNEALIWQQLAGSDAPHGETITARLEDRDDRLGARSRYAIGGRLADGAGRPITGAQVELVAVATTAAAAPTRVAILATDRDGRWRAGELHASDGSRLYVARHLDGNTTVSRTVRATVPVALVARPRRLASGRRVVVGRVNASAPTSAIRVLLAARRSGDWHTERTAPARPGGRFELPVPARLHGPVAVFVAPDPDLPYAPAGRVVDLARP